MGTFLKYGEHSHAVGECIVVISRQGLFHGDRQWAYRELWSVQGRLQAAGTAAVKTALDALETAYFVHRNSIQLVDDTLGILQELNTGNTVDGTQVVQSVSYPIGDRAEFSTYRNYTVSVAGVIPDTSGLLESSQTISYRGTGGSIFRLITSLTGSPQKQLVQVASTQVITQRGSIVTNGSIPVVPGPLYPTDEHEEARDISFEDFPDHSGRKRATWSYTMEVAGSKR